MSGLSVHAPIGGRLLELAQVPDPVFAQHMVGPGIAIDPEPRSGVVDVTSPVAGHVGALHPHAFAIDAPGGQVLVHLGIDTVSLRGESFETAVSPGEEVSRGQVVIRWRIEGIGALSPLVPVVALGVQHVEMLAGPGAQVEAGAELFRITG